MGSCCCCSTPCSVCKQDSAKEKCHECLQLVCHDCSIRRAKKNAAGSGRADEKEDFPLLCSECDDKKHTQPVRDELNKAKSRIEEIEEGSASRKRIGEGEEGWNDPELVYKSRQLTVENERLHVHLRKKEAELQALKDQFNHKALAVIDRGAQLSLCTGPPMTRNKSVANASHGMAKRDNLMKEDAWWDQHYAKAAAASAAYNSGDVEVGLQEGQRQDGPLGAAQRELCFCHGKGMYPSATGSLFNDL